MPEPGWHLPYMTPGERVLWQTEPEKRRLGFLPIALLSMGLLISLCIPAGMGLYGLFSRTGSPKGPALLCSFAGTAWLVLAACQALFPWLLRQMGRRHPDFILTDRRILRNRGNRVDAVLLHQLPAPTLTHHADGTATLTFWPAVAHNPEQDSGRANLGSLLGFTIPRIQHADKLQAALRDTRVKHERPRPIADAPLLPIEPDEVLLWQGQPGSRRPLLQRLSGRYIPANSGHWLIGMWIILLAAGFLAMAVTAIGWQRDMWPLYLTLAGMMALGVAVAFAPLIRSLRHTRRTDYVLTNRRIIRRIDGFTSELRLDQPTPLMIYLAGGMGGHATLMLTTLPTHHGGKTIALSDAATSMEGFQLRDIPDAARVADLIAAITALRKEPARDNA